MPSRCVRTLPVAPRGTRPFRRPRPESWPTRIRCVPFANCDGSAATVLALDRVAPAADYVDFRLSPDETRLAYSRVDPVTQAPDVWVHDLRSGAIQRVTSDSLTEASVLWSPDGDELIYRSNRGSAEQPTVPRERERALEVPRCC